MDLTASAHIAGGSLEAGEPIAPTSRFGRMFPELPGWTPGGRTDEACRERIDRSEAALVRDPDAWQPSDFNERIAAGYTYFAQFVVHDLTFDRREPPEFPAPDPLRPVAPRTAVLDLDSLYGGGPAVSPDLYQPGTGRFVIGRTPEGELDLPRAATGTPGSRAAGRFDRRRPALIPDPRNDENVLIAQLHLAFLRLHNRMLDGGHARDFDEARRLVLAHYHQVLRHDLLPLLCGRRALRALGDDPARPRLRHLDADHAPFVPVEFAVGAMRAGHAMIRPSYALNDFLPQTFVVFEDRAPHRNLAGGRVLPPNWTLQWDRFLPWLGSEPQPSKRIEPRLVRALRFLPIATPDARFRRLGVRTLERAWRLGVPGGPDVAEELGRRAVSKERSLWLYVLEEAQLEKHGRKLGRVGATIVAETIGWLLSATPDAWFHRQSEFRSLIEPANGSDALRLADLLAFAGMPMTAEDWRGRPRV